MPRRRLLLAAGLIVVTGVVVAVVVVTRDGDDPRAGSEDLGTGEQPIEIARTPVSYRIEYRVETRTGNEVSATSERVTVLRPFASRIETYAGPEPGGEPTSTQIANFGRLLLGSGGADDAVIAAPPGPAPRDLRVATVLDEAVEEGLLVPREQRRVAARECQVYRSSGLLGAAESIAPHAGGEHADTCLDEAGLALEEVLYDEQGEVRVRRVAIAVEEDPALPEDAFRVGEPTVPVRDGGGAVTPLRPDSRTPGTFWELESAPDGFEHRGRYAVVPPQVEAFTDPRQRERRTGSVADVYAAGPDVVVVERGGTLGGVDVLPEVPHARRVDVGRLGEAEVLLAPSGSEVRVDLGGGRFVRVLGTVASDDLVEIARAMREVEGGTLEVVSGQTG